MEKLLVKYKYINHPDHKRSVLFQSKIALKPPGGRVQSIYKETYKSKVSRQYI